MQILENALSEYIYDIYEHQSSRLVTFAQENNYLNGSISIYKIGTDAEQAIVEEIMNAFKSYFGWELFASNVRLVQTPHSTGDYHVIVNFKVLEWIITIDTKDSIIDSFKNPVIS